MGSNAYLLQALEGLWTLQDSTSWKIHPGMLCCGRGLLPWQDSGCFGNFCGPIVEKPTFLSHPGAGAHTSENLLSIYGLWRICATQRQSMTGSTRWSDRLERQDSREVGSWASGYNSSVTSQLDANAQGKRRLDKLVSTCCILEDMPPKTSNKPMRWAPDSPATDECSLLPYNTCSPNKNSQLSQGRLTGQRHQQTLRTQFSKNGNV